jgi:anti-sigma factor RsiW
MKKCSAIENLLPLYSEGTLSDAEKRVVEEHLSDCAACQKELAYLQKAGQLVNHLSDVEEPPWFQQKIMARVREEAGKKSFAQKWFYPLRIKIPVQIMATIVIAVLVVYIYRSGDEQVKQILPGAAKPVIEMQKEQAPAQMPQAGDMVLSPAAPPEKAAPREKLKQDKQVPVQVAAGGVQKSEAPASKPNAAKESGVSRTKGLSESKDKANRALPAKQNESERALPQMADQERKAAEHALPALAKKRESFKMDAPAAPQSMGASAVALPQARVLVRVDDLNAALAEVEKVLAQYDAKKVTKQLAEGEALIRAEVSGKNWKDIFSKLKRIGQVDEKIMPTDIGERDLNVIIEISGR